MQESHIAYLTTAYAIMAVLLIGELVLLRIQSKHVRRLQEQD